MIYAFGEFELDEARGELRRAGALVPLEPKPFAVLRHLIRHRQRVVSKGELLQRVWPEVAVADDSLSGAILRVRRALRDTGAEQRFLHTLRGRGFRFVAPVQERSAEATPGSAEARWERGDFVGRAEVLAGLGGALEEVSRGRGRIVLLTGEPGIGKTRTAEELARGASTAGNPPLVLTGWCASLGCRDTAAVRQVAPRARRQRGPPARREAPAVALFSPVPRIVNLPSSSPCGGMVCVGPITESTEGTSDGRKAHRRRVSRTRGGTGDMSSLLPSWSRPCLVYRQPMRLFRDLRVLLAALAWLLFAPAASLFADDSGGGEAPQAAAWPIPEEGSCAPKGGLLPGPSSLEDAAPLPFQPGDVFGLDRIQVLENYLPEFIWENREQFFYEGMRLEIGPCFRDYAAPAFFREATESLKGRARLLENGGLDDYVAGLPFSPDLIARGDPDAGIKWLWNVEHRYQAAGFRGKFRMTDLLGRVGRAEPFEGEMFKILLAHRSDLSAAGYAMKGERGKHWIAGGLFFKPFDAREYAWRQFRDLEHERSPERSDDLHAYLPQWRRVRRLNANQVEGLYMPSFAVGVQPSQQLAVGAGGGTDAGGMASAGGVGGVSGTITAKRSGYEGLEIRPLLYDVALVGMHDVLAPINSAVPCYPENPDRDFGLWGLSFASDRWDLRRALVLEATSKAPTGGDRDAKLILYVDLQTLQPLYMATYDGKGEMTNVGHYVSRWSGDREDYPSWPDDPQRETRVLDSVGVAFANLSEEGSWRRESWENVATPPPDGVIQRMISVNQLTKRR